MTAAARDRRRIASCLGAAAVFLLVSANALSAQELVRITVPALVSFEVVDVGSSVTGSPNPTRVSYDNGVLLPLHALRISVRAEGNLTAAGSSIAASKVSWTTSNTSNGVGINGTLSSSVYTQVFQSSTGASSGGVDVAWTLSAPGTPVRAATHQATLRWKLEAVTP